MRWLDGGSARWELDQAGRVMSARRRGPQQLMAHGRRQEDCRLTILCDKRRYGILRQEDPVYWLDAVIVI